jgi:hypothetical protein
MRITVRGWGRDQGETTIMSAALADAESGGDTYSKGKLYKTVDYPESRGFTKVRISTSAEVRLGGNYLLQVELNREELAQLFYDTHSGAMVRMVRSFIEDEERQEHVRLLERMAQRNERKQLRSAQEEQAESK